MRIVTLSLALLALTAACEDPKPGSTTTAATSAPSASATASAAPSRSVAPIATASAAVAAPVASASGPPSWLTLGADRSVKERIASGSNRGCYVIKTKNGDELDCPPMTSPAATVDEVDLEKGHDCPAGFAASGEDTCSRSCTSNKDCHGKNICADRQCQP